ncbi:hypothetical protein F0562_029576 [Nyssa sinensis]|uniref:Uncharacterized protein n=1 Tax=Nyssa sinensis TaxID=561372 RepID=A0A5J5B374_9ASTE|nr:hypothetical protein F0562_029576 [Nyssa sinensis]
MSSPSNSLPQNNQEPYIRARNNPFFDGMRKGDAIVMDMATIFDFRGKVASQNISWSVSDIGDKESRNIGTGITKKVAYSPSKGSPSDVILEPYGQSIYGMWSKISKTTTFPSPSIQSGLSIDFEEENELTKESSLRAYEANEESYTLTSLERP